MQDQDMPSKAEYLANILAGKEIAGYTALTVQISHRFLLLKNMAKVAD